MKVQQFREFLFLLGEQSIDIFDYFGREELHGLTRTECLQVEDTDHSAYIAGLCNYIPNKENKYDKDSPMFIFINEQRLRMTYMDITLINHEAMHLAFSIFNWDMKKEEEMIRLFTYYYRYIGNLRPGKDVRQTAMIEMQCGKCVGRVQKYFINEVAKWQ